MKLFARLIKSIQKVNNKANKVRQEKKQKVRIFNKYLGQRASKSKSIN
jgi:hypothetical protein